MPHRLLCVGILLFWTIAAGLLFTRDFLPTLLLGPPPDLRTISQADEPAGPSRWSILAGEDDRFVDLRSIGQITTETSRKRDGWVRLTSQAWIDSGELLKLPLLSQGQAGRILVWGACEIDPSGNLNTFRASVRFADDPKKEVLTLDGRHRKDLLEITSRGPIPLLNGNQTVSYRPRGIVQNTLGPLEKMPGLQVGQKWETQVFSPLSGSIQSCRVEVTGMQHIVWGSTTVATLKVVTHMTPMSATTWVRASDGLVIRQELPFPSRVKLLLERLPDEAQPANASQSPSGSRGRGRR